MVLKRTLILGLTCSLALVLLASCETVEEQRQDEQRHGGWIGSGPAASGTQVEKAPPSHAPAHGQRRKQVCGYELLYDSNWGVYVVVGVRDCYYLDKTGKIVWDPTVGKSDDP